MRVLGLLGHVLCHVCEEQLYASLAGITHAVTSAGLNAGGILLLVVALTK
jgi:hypothetical protein